MSDIKKIILYIAASIDGYIADAEGTVDWLGNYPITDTMNYDYDDFIASVDTIVMGGSSYREVLKMEALPHYKNQKMYVVTRGVTEQAADNVQFITDDAIERIRELRHGEGKDIWLFGGGQLTAMLLAGNLVDQMRIATIPVTLGDGIPLFPKQPTGAIWEVTESKTYANGIRTATYCRK